MFAIFTRRPWLILGLTLFKLGYLGAISDVAWVWPSLDEGKFYEVMARWPAGGGPVFASHFATWDGAHYLFLSEVGYVEGVSSCAFYPLWPKVIQWCSIFAGSSHLVTGLVLANVFSMAAWCIFYHTVALRFGEGVARWALIFLIVFPGSLFYQFVYSEALFFPLVMMVWCGLERGGYRLAWFAAFLLPLTRAIGVFVVLPVIWHWLLQRPWGQSDRWLATERLRRDPVCDLLRERWHGIVMLAAPLLGWATYLGFMWVWTDNPWEGIQAQRFWGVHSITNLFDVPKFLTGFFSPTELHGFRGSVLDRAAFLFLMCLLPLIWRLGKDLMVWTYVLGVIPAMSGTFTSYVRYHSCVFPFFLALAVWLLARRAAWPRWTVLGIFAAGHAVLVWRFVNFRWAG